MPELRHAPNVRRGREHHQDAKDAGLNCLNFLLMTRNEPMPVGRDAGRFDFNWVQSNDYDGPARTDAIAVVSRGGASSDLYLAGDRLAREHLASSRMAA